MKNTHKLLFLFVGVACVLIAAIVLRTCHVSEGDLEFYYKEKSARRGAIRTAKEEKKSVSFSQERTGVVRTLWFDANNGLRRQFHLQASTAQFDFSLAHGEHHPQETFLRPHGWYQEKIGWEVRSDAREVEQQNGVWKECKSKQFLTEKRMDDVGPFQVIRYYDAIKAIWDIDKNALTFYKVNFTDYKKNDHTASFEVDEASEILKGYADEMTLYFSDDGKEEVTSSGMKLHLLTPKVG